MTATTQPAAVRVPSRAVLLGLADADGVLDARPLFDAANACGITDTAMRLTIRRLIDEGLVDVTGRGRSAAITLTEAGLRERAPDVGWMAFAARLDAGLVRWDGVWHLVSFEIAEKPT